MNLIWIHLLTQSGFDEPDLDPFAYLLSRIGFKAATEVYAIVEGPRFCINAYVEIICGIKFCSIIPCGIKWCRVSVEIAVRHHYIRTLHRSHTTTSAHVTRLVPRTVHDH
jgi:hypothetical protein